MSLRLLPGAGALVNPALIRGYSHFELDNIFPRGQHTVFLHVLQSGERSQVEAGLRHIFSSLCHSSHYDPEILYSLCHQLLQVPKALPEYEEIPLCFASVEQAVELSGSIQSLISNFRITYLDAMEPYFHLISTRTGAPVQRAVHFIEEHYAEPLTLNQVATQVHLSSAYFSSVFKRETGSAFSEYLTLCRMNAAKNLLRHTGTPIAEIAEQVGYMDPKYFSKTFSNMFGISPQKYRKL